MRFSILMKGYHEGAPRLVDEVSHSSSSKEEKQVQTRLKRHAYDNKELKNEIVREIDFFIAC